MHMQSPASTRLGARLFKAVLFSAGISAIVAGCGGGSGRNNIPGVSSTTSTPTAPATSTPATTSAFAATNLVTDSGTNAPHVDSNLVNGWGIAFNPTGVVWVSDQGTSMSTLYDGNGVAQSLVVSIPPAAGGPAGPTGILFNSTQDFQVMENGVTAAPLFIFAGTGGILAGWSPTVDGTHAVKMVDTSASATPTAYTGLTMSSFQGKNYLYAADFRNGKVDVYDPTWNKVTLPGGTFADPNVPANFAPFGIKAIGNRIFVTYAEHAANGPKETLGPGLGFIDVFDPSGAMISRFATGGALNAPWGLAVAPANFGAFSNMLIVGNFGDGTLNVFDPTSGAQLGTLSDANQKPIAVPGLWGIAFGNGVDNQPTNTLFYAAGPNGEQDGLYGRIDLQ